MAQPGRTAYRGFDYQIRVSIWLSLVFLVEKEIAEAVEVEPLTGEDLELLRSDDTETDTSAIATGFHAVGEELAGDRAGAAEAPPLRRYIVQIKGRHVGQWPAGQLLGILKGEGKETERVWPVEVMKAHRDVGLLFVTDSTLSGDLSWFLVEDPTFPLRAEPRPANAQETWGEHLSAVGDDVLARFGVLQGQRYDALEAKIDAILARELNVPHARRGTLREVLFARFRAAMLSDTDARVDVHELRQFARRAGGLPGGPDPFVEPKNWAEIQRILREQHAIVLIGEPGSGKSTAAERLVYEHRVSGEPFALVTPERPSELRRLSQEKEPLIVYVEDPFGRYQPGKDDDDWRLALDGFCASVRADLKLVVTSRTAFAAQYLDDEKAVPRLRRHRFHFGGEIFDRHRLLEEHVNKEARMDEALRAWLATQADRIAAALDRPISYFVFVPRAADLAPDQRTDARLEELLREASIAELGKDLERTFEQEQEGVRAGLAAVWIALEAWPFRHRIDDRLTFFEEALLDLGAEVSGARAKLLEHRWLRMRDGEARMHPTYMEACLHVLAKNKNLTTRMVQRLLQAYSRQGRADDVEAVFSAVTERGFVATGMKRELAAFAADCLRTSAAREEGGPAFAAAITLLAANGAEEDPMAMLARALSQGFSLVRRGDGHLFGEEWMPPAWAANKADRRLVTEHADTPTVVRAFVRRGFPTIVDAWHPGAERVVELLYDLVDVSTEFDAVLARISRFGSFLVDVVAIGAARSRNADPDRMVARAVAEERAYEKWLHDLGPYDEDSYAANEHLQEIAYDRRRAAVGIVGALLDAQAVRGEPAWAATRGEPLVFELFAERVRYGKERDQEVIRRVFSACPVDMRAPIVAALLSRPAALDLALELLPRAPAYAWPDLLGRHFRIDFDAPEQRARCANAFRVLKAPAETLPPPERVALAYALEREDEHRLLFMSIVDRLGESEQLALSALLSKPEANAQASVNLLTEIAHSGFSAARVALVALARAGRMLDDLVDVWLSVDARVEDALAALDAAASASPPTSLERARRALGHERARVRSRALALLGKMPGGEAIDAILSVMTDVTDSVRMAAVGALAGRAEPRAWQAIVAMLADAADTSEAARHGYGYGGYDDEEPEYGVAIEAAHALTALDPWPDETQAAVSAFLDSSSITRGAVEGILRSKLVPRGAIATT